ncbi:MAG: transposase [Elusimicrobiota bacterium]|nr:transposase [Elusimicrobiota bacterium]
MFTFSTEVGFSDINNTYLVKSKIPSNLVLHFGDIWMIDQIFKKSSLESVLENVIPESSDTFKALIAHRIINKDEASCYAEEWYRKSYANILYPCARLESPRISEFHAKIGTEENYRKFFSSYLNIISKKDEFANKISLPILIDSTGVPNAIKTHLTAINSHNGKISNEMRLIYVADKNTKLPIYFRCVPGNIIDNSTLITTFNTLIAYDLKIELVIIDAGYFSGNNLEQLTKNNIPYLTRMPKHRTEYKELMAEHGSDLFCGQNYITYHDRVLFCKKVPTKLFGSSNYAYIIMDFLEFHDELKKKAITSKDDPNKSTIFDEFKDSAGRFLILSSNDYEIDDIMQLYYSRQIIEQIFDISKTYTGLTPQRGWSEETIRGTLLISFIATVIYSYIGNKLADSKFSPHGALKYMHNIHIKIYESITLIEDLTKIQKDIFNHLELACPFELESLNPLHKASFLKPSEKKKRGRPKGTKNKPKPGSAFDMSLTPGDIPKSGRSRGRPKGSKNKPKPGSAFDMSLTPGDIPKSGRSRGRPKGSKNKPKPELAVVTSQTPDDILK